MIPTFSQVLVIFAPDLYIRIIGSVSLVYLIRTILCYTLKACAIW